MQQSKIEQAKEIAVRPNNKGRTADETAEVIGFNHDGASYRAQLLADRKMKEKTGKAAPRYPVVTLVLYFGYGRCWKTPGTLYECLDIPEELKPFVNDYRVNLYEIAYLTDEQVQMFTSDFKVVADYFV